MFCEQCGAQVPDGMRFCDQCGAPVMPDDAVPGAPQGSEPYMQPMQQEPMRDMQPGNMQPGRTPYMGGQGGSMPGMPPGRMPAMSPGATMPSGYSAPRKSPLVPIIIAVVAVLVLGLGGFGVYKNIDKIKGFIAKVNGDEKPPEEVPPILTPPAKLEPTLTPTEDIEPTMTPMEDIEPTQMPDKEDPDKPDDPDRPEGTKEAQDTPASVAISGGKWERNGSGGRIYTVKGEMQKRCWIKDEGAYLYVDASGYQMSNNWSDDGFWLDESGRWDKSVQQRKDDPEPLTDITYVNKAYKDNTGYCRSGVFSGSKKKNDMTVTFEYQWDDMTYNISPLGCGTYVLTDASGMLDPMDVVHTIVMSVSEDQSEILISEYGNTTAITADGSSGSSGKSSNSSYGKGSGSKGSGSGNVTVTDIVEMARVKSGAPNAELDSVDPDGTLNIRLYGNGTQDTWDWYYINPNTLQGTNIVGDSVNLN